MRTVFLSSVQSRMGSRRLPETMSLMPLLWPGHFLENMATALVDQVLREKDRGKNCHEAQDGRLLLLKFEPRHPFQRTCCRAELANFEVVHAKGVFKELHTSFPRALTFQLARPWPLKLIT